MANCVTCTAPTHTHLCGSCLGLLAADLQSLISHWRTDAHGQQLPGIAAELTTTLARQDRIGGGPIGIVVRNAETELPINLAASDRAHELRNCLSTWVRDLWETHGVRDTDDTLPALDCDNTIVDMAAWLLRHPNWISIHRATAKLYSDITGTIRRAQHTIDRPADRIYCGPCDSDNCTTDLYAHPDAKVITCPECGFRYDIEARHNWLLHHAKQRLGTSTEVAAFVRMLGTPCTPAAIRNYADRGRIEQHGNNQRGHPLYQVGEAHAAARRAHQRRKAS